MPDAIVLTGRIAGAGLGFSIFDSNDLSTVRGGSLALLEMVRRVGDALKAAFPATYKQLSSGGSDLVFEVEGVDETALRAELQKTIDAALAEALRLGDGPAKMLPGDFTLLSACVARQDVKKAAPATSDKAMAANAIAAARAATAVQQYRRLSMPLHEAATWAKAPGFCDIDHMRPGVGEAKRGNSTIRVSRFTERRRAFGQQERQLFYDRILRDGAELAANTGDAAAGEICGGVLRRLEGEDLYFAREFSQLCAEGESKKEEDFRKRLRVALPSKICVLHLDGNGFGAAIAALAGRQAELDALSAYIRLRQAQLLAAAVTAAMDCDAMRFGDAESVRRLRLQTLLWGGDEMTFIVPAWFGFDFLAAIEPALQGWTPMLGEQPLSQGPLTHGVGLVFADRKMPIALLRSLAGKVSDSAKAQKPGAGVQALVLEGFDLPDTSTESLRRRLFELPEGMRGNEIDAAFQLQAKDETVFDLARWRKLERELPRSQAHKLLRGLRTKHGSLRAAHEKASVKEVEDELKRVGSTAPDHAALAGQLVCATGKARILPLLTLLHLADYLAPLKAQA